MNKAVLALLLISLPLAACGRRDKFSKSLNLGGVVEISSWPKVPAGVYGFNLYMAKAQNGDFEKVTDEPVTGGKIMVPYLEPDRDYWFKLSYVMKDGRESKPGGAWKRRSTASKR